MKVYIGPYKNWIGPYQIAEIILFWKNKHRDRAVCTFGKWLATKKDGSPSRFAALCTWIDSKKKRTVNIRIDNYDVWSMDSTLGLIALPMLRKLKLSSSAPCVADVDVPDYLRSTNAPTPSCSGVDDNWHARWEWAMDEMIYAFETAETDWEFNEQRTDRVAIQSRITNGFRLFGTYYQGLWN